MSTTLPAGYSQALQTALRAEHAAMFVVSSLGAQTSSTGEPDLFGSLTAAFADHRQQRDRLTEILREAGARPASAEPSYRLPEDLGDPGVRVRRAREVEQACTEAYAALVVQAVRGERAFAVRSLQTTAVRELAFKGTPASLPGSDEYAKR